MNSLQFSYNNIQMLNLSKFEFLDDLFLIFLIDERDTSWLCLIGETGAIHCGSKRNARFFLNLFLSLVLNKTYYML